MSILIKGIDMPKICGVCEFNYCLEGGSYEWWECVILHDDINQFDTRRTDCPLVEIPTPHGRLIDADLFKEIIKDSVPSWTIGVKIPTYGDMDIMDKIYFIPTILEAEE